MGTFTAGYGTLLRAYLLGVRDGWQQPYDRSKPTERLDMTTERIAEYLRSLAPWALARLAGCLDPDTEDSPGAHFLALVRDSVAEDWDRLTEHDDDPDYDGAVSEIAEGCVPTYTHDLWATFVDLGAYDEDVTDHGPIESLDQAARVALYMIAIRLVYALVDEGKELADEEGEDQ